MTRNTRNKRTTKKPQRTSITLDTLRAAPALDKVDELTGISFVSENDTWFTSSRAVAEKFGKAHKDVLRAHKNLSTSAQFNGRNFAPVRYTDDKGESRPEILMTRDGFSMLAFSFTGPEVAEWKEQFLDAFNRMESGIKEMAQRVRELSAEVEALKTMSLQGGNVRRLPSRNQGTILAPCYTENLFGEIDVTWERRKKDDLSAVELLKAQLKQATRTAVGLTKRIEELHSEIDKQDMRERNAIKALASHHSYKGVS